MVDPWIFSHLILFVDSIYTRWCVPFYRCATCLLFFSFRLVIVRRVPYRASVWFERPVRRGVIYFLNFFSGTSIKRHG